MNKRANNEGDPRPGSLLEAGVSLDFGGQLGSGSRQRSRHQTQPAEGGQNLPAATDFGGPLGGQPETVSHNPFNFPQLPPDSLF